MEEGGVILLALPALDDTGNFATFYAPSKKKRQSLQSHANQATRTSPIPPTSRRTRSQSAPASRVREVPVPHRPSPLKTVPVPHRRSPLKTKPRALPSQANQATCNPQTPSNSRCTRSQAAPEWTVQEILVLLSVIASIDDHWLKELSSFQRWKMISDDCVDMNVVRSSRQCKSKWETLLADYKKIRKWESLAKEKSYWSLREERRKRCELPVSFQREVFDAMDAVIPIQLHRSDSKKSDPDNDLGSEEEELVGRKKSTEKDHAIRSSEEQTTNAQSPDASRLMVRRLHESAARVRAAVGEEESPNGGSCSSSSGLETEFARKQADELIRSLRGLTNVLDEFCEVVRNGGFHG